MAFTCNTTYNSKAMAAMSRVVRKTVRVKVNRCSKLFSWLVIVLCLLCVCISWEEPWIAASDAVVAVLLLLINWKQDAINGFFARRRAMPGMETASAAFYPDYYEVRIAGAVTQWQYSKVLVLAETGDYVVFALGKNYTQAFEKAGLEGGTEEEFRRWLEEKTGKQMRKIGR